MTNIVPAVETFPHAGVPGARTPAEVFDGWTARGLTPVEVTSADVTQRISIEFNAVTGELKWTVDKADGLQAIGLLFQTLVDVGQQLLQAQARPALTSGQARIALRLDGNQIQMVAEPTNEPIVLRGLLGAALLKLIQGDATPDALAGVMRFEITP